MNGIIFSVDRSVVNAGRGIRTVFYLKGCALRCLWCSTPEGLKAPVEPNLRPSTYDRNPEQFGHTWEVKEVIDTALRDKPFFDQSHGGITLSGGEPLMQPDFCLDIIRAAHKAGMTCGLDTSGYTLNLSEHDQITARECLCEADFLLYDLKVMDSALHLKFTEVNNANILENLQFASSIGQEIIIRTPVIPQHNDSDDNFLNEIAFLRDELPSPVEYVELLTYHDYGSQTYPKVGMTYSLSDLKAPSQERMRLIASMFYLAGIKVLIDGVEYEK
jgi:pyruvate formate lyase activating enzyme